MKDTTTSRRTLRRSVHALVTVLAATLAVTTVASAPAQASVAVTPDPTAKVGGGGVHALAVEGGRTYIGGLFTTVGGQPRANVAAINADGKVDPAFNPGTNGRVTAVAVSADGGVVYLGGTFTQVGGVARANLAAVDAVSGAVIGSWQADTGGTNPEVSSLAVRGSTLYVSGRFGTIKGATRARLAALDAATGELLTGFRPRPNGYVREVVVAPNGDVYVTGGFTTLGGQARLAAGAVDGTTGAPTGFAPTGDGGPGVTIDVSPDGSRVFYGTENNTLFAYDPAVSNAPVWSFKTSGNTQAIEVVADEMWIGGHFSQIVTGKIPRPFLASVNPATGAINAWDSQCTGGKQGVWALQHDGDDLHAGGYFAAFGAVKQPRYARFSVTP